MGRSAGRGGSCPTARVWVGSTMRSSYESSKWRSYFAPSPVTGIRRWWMNSQPNTQLIWRRGSLLQFKIRLICGMDQKAAHALIELIGSLACHRQYFCSALELMEEFESTGCNFVAKKSQFAQSVNNRIHLFGLISCSQNLISHSFIIDNVGGPEQNSATNPRFLGYAAPLLPAGNRARNESIAICLTSGPFPLSGCGLC
jgi:hypothetical protein